MSEAFADDDSNFDQRFLEMMTAAGFDDKPSQADLERRQEVLADLGASAVGAGVFDHITVYV